MQSIRGRGKVEALFRPLHERGDGDGTGDGGAEVRESGHPAAKGAEVKGLEGEDVVEGEVVRVRALKCMEGWEGSGSGKRR
jgi:hypothetical protein